MSTEIDPAIEPVVVRAADHERIRSDTASVVERADGSLLIAYHSYSHGPEGGTDFGAAKIYLAESADGGRRWTNERMVADILPGDLNVMSPFLCRVEDEILLGYVRNHSPGDTSMHLHRSVDGGVSFGDSAPSGSMLMSTGSRAAHPVWSDWTQVAWCCRCRVVMRSG